MADRGARLASGGGERLFLELLRPEGPRGCSGITVEALVRAADLGFRHGLFLPVDRRVREQSAQFFESDAAERYEQAIRPLRFRHIAYALRYDEAEQGLLALLDAAAVPTVILKGSSFARELYGDKHGRTCADIDLLVRVGDLPAADAALRGGGYRREDDRPLAFWVRRLHHAVYRRPGEVLPVEIHWNFSIPGFFNLNPGEIWSGVTLEGLRGRLNPEMTLTLLLMHHHLHGCADLRTLVDLLRAFERYRDDLPPGRLPERLRETGLLVTAGIARRQAEKLWGPRRWEIDGRGPRRRLRVRLLSGAADPALRPGRQPRAADRFLHALVHRMGLDSPRRVLASVTKTLLPPAADIRALYGGQSGGPAGYVRYFLWRVRGRRAGEGKKEGRQR